MILLSREELNFFSELSPCDSLLPIIPCSSGDLKLDVEPLGVRLPCRDEVMLGGSECTVFSGVGEAVFTLFIIASNFYKTKQTMSLLTNKLWKYSRLPIDT